MKTWHRWLIGLACVAVFAGFIGTLAVIAPAAPKTEPVTAIKLMQARGINYQRGNSLLNAQLGSVTRFHGRTVVVLGTGGGSFSGESRPALVFGIRLGRDVHFIQTTNYVVRIKAGSPRVTYRINKPDRELYRHELGRSVLKDIYESDEHGYRKMAPEELLNELKTTFVVHLSQADFNKAFGSLD